MTDEDVTQNAGELLDELGDIRQRARTTRHGFWFPLLIFGLLITALAPLYYGSSGSGSYSFSDPLGKVVAAFGSGTPNPAVTAGLWVAAIVGGALLTRAWYSWYGNVVGLTTRVRGSVLTWVVGIMLATVVVLFPLAWTLPIAYLGTLALVPIAAGLWALAVAERSRFLWATTAIFTVLALLAGSSYLSILHSVPSNVSQPLFILVPGLVLLVAACWAWARDWRRRS